MAQEVFLGNGENLIVKTSTVVTLHENLSVAAENTVFVLPVKIVADFDEIPSDYHEIFLNVLTSKYYNKVSFGHNPFGEYKPPKKKRWYQFWK
jgi:hypothetical protein